MFKDKEKRNLRFGLLIFIGIVVFCLAQLSWWIVFQITNIKTQQKMEIAIIEQKIALVINRVNNDFGRLTDLSEYLLQTADNKNKLKECITNVSSDPAVKGFLIYDKGVLTFLSGKSDSTFFANIDDRLLLYFDPGYVDEIIKPYREEIVFKANGHSSKYRAWLDSSLFAITSDKLASFDENSRRKVIMFASEGSFFLIILIFGAFMIYRTLRKSEELQLRQVNFIQAVTHDFRTPLTSLRLYLQTLNQGRVKPEKAAELYPKMLADCDRLEGLVDNVLEAGRMNRKRSELDLSRKDFSKELNIMIDRIRPFVAGLGGKIETDIGPDIYVNMDLNAFERAFSGLVDNAMKYSPPERRVVTISLKSNLKEAVLIIRDNGDGIPAREQKKIFERFYRTDTKRSREVKGTGLGLYLVRQIVRNHNGTISVNSGGEGKGTEFIIRIPLVYKS